MNRKRTLVIISTVSAMGALAALAKTAQFANFSLFPSQSQPVAPISIEIIPTPTFEGCAYMWAYHEAPELSARLEPMILAIHPQASSTASYFGEDCLYSDGHSTFTAMETNFHLQLPVSDLADERALGDWMAQALEVILQIPEAEIRGNYGIAEFSFFREGTQELIVRVPLLTYMTQVRGKTGVELFRFFAAP